MEANALAQRKRAQRKRSQRAAREEEARRKREEEAKDDKTCWYCDMGEANGPLVRLCACRGTNMWVHKACVEVWRRTSTSEEAAYRCSLCKDHYRDALSLELLSARLQAERTGGQVTHFTLATLASELGVQGRYDEAKPLYREALGGAARDPR